MNKSIDNGATNSSELPSSLCEFRRPVSREVSRSVIKSVNSFGELEREHSTGLLITPESFNDVFSYLLYLVNRYGVRCREMFMNDCCAMDSSELRYFGVEAFERVPSYSYWLEGYNSLPLEIRERFEMIENSLVSGYYQREMMNIASRSDGSVEDARVFSFWKKLSDISEKRQERMEDRQFKRDMSRVGFDDGVESTLRVLKRLSDSDLLRAKSAIEGVSRLVSVSGVDGDRGIDE